MRNPARAVVYIVATADVDTSAEVEPGLPPTTVTRTAFPLEVFCNWCYTILPNECRTVQLISKYPGVFKTILFAAVVIDGEFGYPIVTIPVPITTSLALFDASATLLICNTSTYVPNDAISLISATFEAVLEARVSNAVRKVFSFVVGI